MWNESPRVGPCRHCGPTPFRQRPTGPRSIRVSCISPVNPGRTIRV
jgi:hypothetical protein